MTILPNKPKPFCTYNHKENAIIDVTVPIYNNHTAQVNGCSSDLSSRRCSPNSKTSVMFLEYIRQQILFSQINMFKIVIQHSASKTAI